MARSFSFPKKLFRGCHSGLLTCVPTRSCRRLGLEAPGAAEVSPHGETAPYTLCAALCGWTGSCPARELTVAVCQAAWMLYFSFYREGKRGKKLPSCT